MSLFKKPINAELIDYMDHVDDSIVLEKIAPLYKDGGRLPIDPRVCFRMHYLYFTRPEISSFRELERQLIGAILLVFPARQKCRFTAP